eukprot:7718648-Pyramimonas_sp.AAC.1
MYGCTASGPPWPPYREGEPGEDCKTSTSWEAHAGQTREYPGASCPHGVSGGPRPDHLRHPGHPDAGPSDTPT